MTASSSYFFPLIAFCLAILAHYLIIDISHRKGIFLDDDEKVQRAHVGSVPRIGGLGIFLACLFMVKEQNFGVYLVLSAIPIFLSGFLEDFSGKVSPIRRLGIMAIGAFMVIFLVPHGIWDDFGFIQVSIWVGAVLTLLLLIGIANGINFIDGQNGLASGSALISFLAMLVISWIQQDAILIYLLLVMVAATLAFLLFNYPKGKIFLGDSGAYLLGFLMTALVILLMERHTLTISPMLLPLLLIYPLWEVIFSTLRKILFDHISPFQSDKYHLHQLIYRNRNMGKAYVPALILLPFQTLACAIAAICPENTVLLGTACLVFILIYCFGYLYQRRLLANREVIDG